MVIENNLSADGTNKLGSYFNPMIPIPSFVLENHYLFAKNQLIGIYSNETKIINDDDDDIIDIRHNDSK